jgi:tetratricopeptide (TPR) repeat protein
MSKSSEVDVAVNRGLMSFLWLLSKAVLGLILIIFSVIIIIPSKAIGSVTSITPASKTGIGRLEQKAIKTYLAGDALEAEKWCTAIDSVSITNSTAFLVRVMLLEDLGGQEQARELYEELLLKEPDNRWACARLAKILVECGEMEQARKLIITSLNGKPLFADSYLAKAMYLAADNCYARAVEAVMKAEELGASTLLCEIRKFNFLLHLENFDEASLSIKNMRKCAPFLPVIGFLQGRLNFMKGNSEKAVAFLEGFNASPDNSKDLVVESFEMISTIRERQGKFEEAKKLIKEAIVLVEKSSESESLASLRHRFDVLDNKMQLSRNPVKINHGIFNIRCSKDVTENTIERIKNSLTSAQVKLAKFYGDEKRKVDVLILDSFSTETPAFFDLATNEIVLSAPAFDGPSNPVGAEVETGHNGESIVVHELSHLYFHALTGKNAFRKINLWAIEGLAEFHSLGSYRSPLAGSNTISTLYTIEQMGNILTMNVSAPSQDRIQAYLQARIMVQYVYETYGADGLNKLVSLTKNVAENLSVNKAFETTFGMDRCKFEEKCITFVRDVLNKQKTVAIRLQ